MIKVRGNKATFTGKDSEKMRMIADGWGLSTQTTFDIMMYEMMGNLARQGVFKNVQKFKVPKKR